MIKMKITVLAVGFPAPLPLPATVTVIDKDFWRKGDVNWDGVIDGVDMELLSAAFGSYPGHKKWNPDCDLNENRVVDMTDIGKASRNYGAEAPVQDVPASLEVAEGKCVLIGYFLGQACKTETSKDSTVIFVFDPLGMVTTAVVL